MFALICCILCLVIFFQIYFWKSIHHLLDISDKVGRGGDENQNETEDLVEKDCIDVVTTDDTFGKEPTQLNERWNVNAN